MRRILVQHGDAGIVEALGRNDAVGQPRMALDQGAGDEPMRHHHQRAAQAAAPVDDEGERVGDAGVERRPVLAVGRGEVGPNGSSARSAYRMPRRSPKSRSCSSGLCSIAIPVREAIGAAVIRARSRSLHRMWTKPSPG